MLCTRTLDCAGNSKRMLQCLVFVWGLLKKLWTPFIRIPFYKGCEFQLLAAGFTHIRSREYTSPHCGRCIAEIHISTQRRYTGKAIPRQLLELRQATNMDLPMAQQKTTPATWLCKTPTIKPHWSLTLRLSQSRWRQNAQAESYKPSTVPSRS